MCLFKSTRKIKSTEDDPPAYDFDAPPPYNDIKNEKIDVVLNQKQIIDFDTIINIIKNNDYLILDNNHPSPASVIKYLVENYNNSSNSNIMVYMIINNKINNKVNNININKQQFKFNNNIYIIGTNNINISINNNTLDFSTYKKGIFTAIWIDENGWKGNAIHYIEGFNKKNFNFDKFIKLF